MISHDRGTSLLLLTLACSAGEINSANSLWDGSFADPQAFKVGDTYYAVGTGKAPDGKQFPILRSRNFTDWEVVGGAMDAIEEMKEYWAPGIFGRDGPLDFSKTSSARPGKKERTRSAPRVSI